MLFSRGRSDRSRGRNRSENAMVLCVGKQHLVPHSASASIVLHCSMVEEAMVPQAGQQHRVHHARRSRRVTVSTVSNSETPGRIDLSGKNVMTQVLWTRWYVCCQPNPRAGLQSLIFFLHQWSVLPAQQLVSVTSHTVSLQFCRFAAAPVAALIARSQGKNASRSSLPGQSEDYFASLPLRHPRSSTFAKESVDEGCRKSHAARSASNSATTGATTGTQKTYCDQECTPVRVQSQQWR
jgi:hypothetical protein